MEKPKKQTVTSWPEHEASRIALLENAKLKPVRRFLQVDANDLAWPARWADDDGDVVRVRLVFDLCDAIDPVRVQIHEGTERKVALRLLRKALRYLERGGWETGLKWWTEDDIPF